MAVARLDKTMNIREHLLKENSRANWDKVISYVGNNPERYAELMAIFFCGELRLVQRSSQPVGVISEKHPELVEPYSKKFIEYLQNDPIDAVKRNVMRLFQYAPISEEIEGELFDIGMEYLRSQKEPIAVKAFSMTVLRRICEKYPELIDELIVQIEILVEEKVSKGVSNRGRHELVRLRTLLRS